MTNYGDLVYDIWHRSILVSLHLAVFAIPYKKQNPAYDWNKGDENPPSALADVVQTSYVETKIRK